MATADGSSGKAGFELDGATFAVAGRTLLQPVSARFEPGRVVGLIGHNGSGKSTLLKLLARQETPTGGAIRLDGRPIGAWSARAFAREVAYLPQNPPLATGLKVKELVALGRYPWHGALGRFSKADADAVREAMALTDVEAFAERLADELSGGERQRVWLAMLVAQQARWLLLDEPTSALDIAHQIEVLGLVETLSETRGLGVIVVLHDVNMAARFCDDLVALHGGRLIARGGPADVIAPDRLEEIYGVAMDVIPHPSTNALLAFAR
ncbi:iron-hydroxamate transporter ATP-binding protein [Methylopila jiangsuensis]|uniref:Iron-hydroxamate transporter ATP-binding protein n=1 Tax=Methylopila jiangsuensis TaxID=586230 RepID=A0A9W6N325_9HYPH|nr:ATP-binding cassette domain-containing protein [Methylopila jiangsuensis]MDR6286135.1 iron complex transport system ATP-binding protein [Methylopila jiangsuensis]GLK75895.1 iron-hydroxamate transporter ATP-binding protein [Methylopila jiangsuensis]